MFESNESFLDGKFLSQKFSSTPLATLFAQSLVWFAWAIISLEIRRFWFWKPRKSQPKRCIFIFRFQSNFIVELWRPVGKRKGISYYIFVVSRKILRIKISKRKWQFILQMTFWNGTKRCRPTGQHFESLAIYLCRPNSIYDWYKTKSTLHLTRWLHCPKIKWFFLQLFYSFICWFLYIILFKSVYYLVCFS